MLEQNVPSLEQAWRLPVLPRGRAPAGRWLTPATKRTAISGRQSQGPHLHRRHLTQATRPRRPFPWLMICRAPAGRRGRQPLHALGGGPPTAAARGYLADVAEYLAGKLARPFRSAGGKG